MMLARPGGFAATSIFVTEPDKIGSIDRYMKKYVLPVIASTDDDGWLALVFGGQAEEWEALIGRDEFPYAADFAAICREVLSALDARIRAKLARMEPELRHLDAHCPGALQ